MERNVAAWAHESVVATQFVSLFSFLTYFFGLKDDPGWRRIILKFLSKIMNRIL